VAPLRWACALQVRRPSDDVNTSEAPVPRGFQRLWPRFRYRVWCLRYWLHCRLTPDEKRHTYWFGEDPSRNADKIERLPNGLVALWFTSDRGRTKRFLFRADDLRQRPREIERLSPERQAARVQRGTSRERTGARRRRRTPARDGPARPGPGEPGDDEPPRLELTRCQVVRPGDLAWTREVAA
jgi:hypothetical protein